MEPLASRAESEKGGMFSCIELSSFACGDATEKWVMMMYDYFPDGLWLFIAVEQSSRVLETGNFDLQASVCLNHKSDHN